MTGIDEAELRYYPVAGDVTKLLEKQIGRLLVVGRDIPSSVDFKRTTVRRREATSDVPLSSGVYYFSDHHKNALLLVHDGTPPGSPYTATWDAPDTDPLINAYGWLDEWWDKSTDVPPPKFDLKDEVVTFPEGQTGRILSRRFFSGMWIYTVRVEGRSGTREEESLRAPIFDDDPFEWIKRSPGDLNRFAATITRAKLDHELTDTVFSYRATRTIFRPYQFRPVMRLLDAEHLRLLIADEVGLGKTIEAGLVWTELDARRAANRVLVVCPSMLVPKWKGEMEERFGYDLEELTKDRLDDLLQRVETDRLPKRYRAVGSVERLRVWGGLERLAELAPRFDLIIADEAHVFRNTGTASHALGAQLADWADALIFLSATPLNLGNDDLRILLELLSPGEFDDRGVLEQRLEPNAILHRVAASLLDRAVTNAQRLEILSGVTALTFGPAVTGREEYGELRAIFAHPYLTHSQVADARRLIRRLHSLSAVVTRTRKAEVDEHKAIREARTIDVQWTEDEANFYQEFDRWQRERARRKGQPTGFVIQMPLRLASTCLPAARARVLGQVSDTDLYTNLDENADVSSEDTVDGLDAPPASVVTAALALSEGMDSKFDAFLPALLGLVEQRKRVLVFTFSRPTLAYLEDRLRGHVRLGVLHGGITDRSERHETMRRFRAGDFDVLLASRVASEGLDFEFCSAVVNYDLPWNPMEVEQRIGRVDRFGQVEDKIIILNFRCPGTIETDIFERLLRRIGVFEDSIGELEPILQSRISDLRRIMFDFTLTEEQRRLKLDQMGAAIEEQRRAHDEVENAASILASTDEAEIDGFEDDLLSNGRYVGQPELALLVKDWADADPAASCRMTPDGTHLVLRGSPKLEAELMGVQAAGERSAAELDDLARYLRDEMDLWICLDQEEARVTSSQLLTTNHALVRAALRVPGHQQVRFVNLEVRTDDIAEGRYVLLLSVARWTGLRPSRELWSSAVSVDDASQPATQAVGSAVLAALAAGTLRGSPGMVLPEGVHDALQRAADELIRRQIDERVRRTAANAALIDTRRISLEETIKRKCRQINSRIDTLRRENKTKTIHMHEAQLRNQDRILREERQKLEGGRHVAMNVEPLAVAIAAVSRSGSSR